MKDESDMIARRLQSGITTIVVDITPRLSARVLSGKEACGGTRPVRYWYLLEGTQWPLIKWCVTAPLYNWYKERLYKEYSDQLYETYKEQLFEQNKNRLLQEYLNNKESKETE